MLRTSVGFAAKSSSLMPRLERTWLPVGRSSNQPGMPSDEVSAQALLAQGLLWMHLLTLCEEAGQVCSQNAAYRVCIVLYATLDVVDDIPLLHIAVSPIEPDGRGSHNGRPNFDLGGNSCRLGHGDCTSETKCRAE